MTLRGQKFELDLDADDFTFNVNERENGDEQSGSVIDDIKERQPANIPSAPTLKSRSGFPEHRPKKVSAFKRQQNAQSAKDPSSKPEPSDQAILHRIAQRSGVDLKTAKDKRDIDLENQRRINDMSLEDIEEARAEILSQFNPETLKRFMHRARIDEDEQHSLVDEPEDQSIPPVIQEPATNTSHTDISTDSPREPTVSEARIAPSTTNPRPSITPSDYAILESRQPALHFPAPPRDASTYTPLDPSSPTFNTSLREKYFPDLPHDPSTISWMTHQSPDPSTIPYHPTSDRAFPPSQIRFSFTGTLIAPSTSQTIPPSLGLHHHGNAPDAAGYTIPELAMLERSTVPAQRCIAYQTLGRVLYRLGRGEFGEKGTDLCEGLWSCVERERAVEVMLAEAGREEGSGHASARAYAVEGVWLWRRGGGGDRGILREGQARAQ